MKTGLQRLHQRQRLEIKGQGLREQTSILHIRSDRQKVRSFVCCSTQTGHFLTGFPGREQTQKVEDSERQNKARI